MTALTIFCLILAAWASLIVLVLLFLAGAKQASRPPEPIETRPFQPGTHYKTDPQSLRRAEDWP